MNDTTKTTHLNKEKFNITQNAANRILELIQQEEDKDVNLRISVLSGGCSGFQYDYNFDKNINEDDIIINKDKVAVVIDETSIEFIEGSVLDYVETLGNAAFEIKNPIATANCGCGNSFSV